MNQPALPAKFGPEVTIPADAKAVTIWAELGPKDDTGMNLSLSQRGLGSVSCTQVCAGEGPASRATASDGVGVEAVARLRGFGSS